MRGSKYRRGTTSPGGDYGLNDGACIRLRPAHVNPVLSYDFVSEKTHDGRKLQLLTLIDEYSRQCLAIKVARRQRAIDVTNTLADARLLHGITQHIRSDNDLKMTAKLVQGWLFRLGTKALYIEPGSPWEHGYNESFNGKLRDE